MTMKVYEMNEYDLVAAASGEEAVAWYTRYSEESYGEEMREEGYPKEIAEEGMSTREVTDELGPTVTFAEHLERATPPDGAPFLFASTEY